MTNAWIRSIGFSAGHLNGDLGRLATFLDRLVDAGAGHCELYAAETDVIVGGRIIDDRLRKLHGICAARPLAYTFHLPLVANLANGQRAARDREVLDAFIEVGAAIGADVLVLHPGRIPGGAGPATQRDALARERDGLRHLAERAAAHGLFVSLENPPPGRDVVAGTIGPHGLDPRDVLSQVRQVNHPHLHATFDFSHAWLAAAYLGFDFAASARALAPAVGHLHIQDCCGLPALDAPARFADEVAYGVHDLHLPVGWGTIPFTDIIPTLAVLPGCRMTIELMERFWPELEATLATTSRLCRLFPAWPAHAGGDTGSPAPSSPDKIRRSTR